MKTRSGEISHWLGLMAITLAIPLTICVSSAQTEFNGTYTGTGMDFGKDAGSTYAMTLTLVNGVVTLNGMPTTGTVSASGNVAFAYPNQACGGAAVTFIGVVATNQSGGAVMIGSAFNSAGGICPASTGVWSAARSTTTTDVSAYNGTYTGTGMDFGKNAGQTYAMTLTLVNGVVTLNGIPTTGTVSASGNVTFAYANQECGGATVTFIGVVTTNQSGGAVMIGSAFNSAGGMCPASTGVWSAARSTTSGIVLTSGNNQSGTISSVLAIPFVVTVTDGGGNLMQGTSVTFAIASTPTGATGQLLSTTTTTTNASGQAASTLTLGNKVGTYTVTASSTGLSGSPVAFTATATAGSATTIALTSGNNQSGTISSVLAIPFVVTVTDAGGNLVQGTSVTFAIASTPTGAAGQSLSTTTTTTNASGQASSILSLGSKAGTYGVTATAQGLSGSPIVFSATANNLIPTVTSVSPNRAGRGSRSNITVTGTNFLAGVTTATFGADITINSQSVTNPTQIASNITVSSTATIGGRDVSVTNQSPGGGTATLANGFTIDTSTPTNVEHFSNTIPREYALEEAYPNPFNPATTISFSLPSQSFVSLKVFDALGREVSILLADELPAGTYSRQWNAEGLPSGVYYYRLQAGSFTETKKLLLLR